MLGEITHEDVKKIIRIDTYREISEEYEKLINEAVTNRWTKIVKKYESTGIDPVDAETSVLDMLDLFQYRMRLMIICCLCETWEQDLYNFLKEEKLIDDIDNDYRCIKCVFNNNFPENKIDSYSKIQEMRQAVNAIKHGKGKSFDKLYEMFGDDILADSTLGIIDENGLKKLIKQNEFDSNTLTSKTLNLERKIKDYYEEIIKFWKDVL